MLIIHLLLSFQVSFAGGACYWSMDAKTLQKSHFSKESYQKEVDRWASFGYVELRENKPKEISFLASTAYFEALLIGISGAADFQTNRRVRKAQKNFQKYLDNLVHKRRYKSVELETEVRSLVESYSEKPWYRNIMNWRFNTKTEEKIALEEAMISFLTVPLNQLFKTWKFEEKKQGRVRDALPPVLDALFTVILNATSFYTTNTIIRGYEIDLPARETILRTNYIKNLSIAEIFERFVKKNDSRIRWKTYSQGLAKIIRRVGVVFIALYVGNQTLPYEMFTMEHRELVLEVSVLTNQVSKEPLTEETARQRMHHILSLSKKGLVLERRALLKQREELSEEN